MSQDRVEAVLEAFRPGRERERDRTQLLSPVRPTTDGIKQEGSGNAAIQPSSSYIATAAATTLPLVPSSAVPSPPANTSTSLST